MKPENRRLSTDPISYAQLKSWALEVLERKRERLGLLNAMDTPSDQHVHPAKTAPGIVGTPGVKKPKGRPRNVLGGKCIRGHTLTVKNTSVTATGYRCLDCRRDRNAL